MWDLIVSVPDHCLSFYFGSFEMRLMWRFPALPARSLCFGLPLHGHVSINLIGY